MKALLPKPEGYVEPEKRERSEKPRRHKEHKEKKDNNFGEFKFHKVDKNNGEVGKSRMDLSSR